MRATFPLDLWIYTAPQPQAPLPGKAQPIAGREAVSRTSAGAPDGLNLVGALFRSYTYTVKVIPA